MSIVVIGSLNLDLTTYVSAFPRPGETLAGKNFTKGFGGKGANQAVMAAKLGAPTVMIGAVGDDDFGREYRAELQRLGISDSGIATICNECTGCATITVDGDGENMIVIVPGANAHISVDHIEKHAATIESAGVVVAQFETPIDATQRAFEIARKAGVRTILNPAPARVVPDELLSVTDIIVPNASELSLLMNHGGECSHGERRELLEKCAQSVGEAAIVTLGGDGGMGCLRAGGSFSFSTPPLDGGVVDTVGAGDAFVGSLAALLVRGIGVDAAAPLAAAVASLSVTKAGAQSSYPALSSLPKGLQDIFTPAKTVNEGA